MRTDGVPVGSFTVDSPAEKSTELLSFNEMRSKFKNSDDPLWHYQIMVDKIERLKDKQEKAATLLGGAVVVNEILPYSIVLNSIKKAIRCFPRVRKGFDLLFDICSNLCEKELIGEDKPEYRLLDPYLLFGVAFLVLCNYDYGKIKMMLREDSKLSKEEKKLFSELEVICNKIDLLYYTPDTKKAKKELYKTLSTRLPQNIAAVFTTTLGNSLPGSYSQKFYAQTTLALAKKTAAEAEPVSGKQQDAAPEKDLAVINKSLLQKLETAEKELKDSRKENKALIMKNEHLTEELSKVHKAQKDYEQQRQAQIPDVLRSVLS